MAKLTLAIILMVASVAAGVGSQSADAPIWTAGFETGDFSEWSYIQGSDPHQGGPGPQYVYVSRAEDEGILAHEGAWVARFERPTGYPDYPHAKCYKEWSAVGKRDQFGRTEDKLPDNGDPSGTYRASLYYPPNYQADRSEWTNIFQFKEEGYVAGKWNQEPSWWINTAVSRAFNGSSDVAVLFVNHWHQDYSGFHPKLLTVPLGRWFEIRADVYEGVRIDWYIDGLLFDQSVDAEYPVGRFYDQSDGWIFGVGHYGGTGTLWVDDVSFAVFPTPTATPTPTVTATSTLIVPSTPTPTPIPTVTPLAYIYFPAVLR